MGDFSALHDTNEAKVDARVWEILNVEPGDPTTVLRSSKFEVILEEAGKYINENLVLQ